jgi:hypothetical protein
LLACRSSQAKIKKSLQAHAFTEGAVLESFFRNPEALAMLYQDFCARHEPGSTAAPLPEAEVCSFVLPHCHMHALI